jgi:hypothetical protein
VESKSDEMLLLQMSHDICLGVQRNSIFSFGAAALLLGLLTNTQLASPTTSTFHIRPQSKTNPMYCGRVTFSCVILRNVRGMELVVLNEKGRGNQAMQSKVAESSATPRTDSFTDQFNRRSCICG